MKKILYLGLLLPFVLSSCQTDQPERTDGKGSIVISSAQNVELDPNVFLTRAAADVNEFTLFVTEEANPSNVISGKFSDFPNGTVDNLESGNYTVKLTSHPDGFTPAFEDAMYEAVETGVAVDVNTNTRIKLEATQANAGVFFVYDESLYSRGGFTEVIPTITQGNNALVYEGANHEAKGYFNPTDAVLTLKDGNQVLTLGGETERILELDEQQLWQVTLKVTGVDENGSITIEASVKVITDPTHFIEFEIGRDTETKKFVEINMYDITSETAYMNMTKLVGDKITFGRIAIYTQGLVDEYLEAGYTLEEAIMMQGTDLSDVRLDLLNMGELEIQFGLSILYTEYVAMAYIEIESGERALTTLAFETPPFFAPVEAQYNWKWYGDFNEDLTWYDDSRDMILDVRFHELWWLGLLKIDEGYVIYDFDGIDEFSFLVEYDVDANELIAPGQLLGYDGNWLNRLSLNTTFTDPETGQQTKYQAGLYVWDENMNPVTRGMVFNTDANGYITSSKYHVSFDLYVEDSVGDPEDFVARYEVAVINDPISLLSAGRASVMPSNMKSELRSTVQKLSAPVYEPAFVKKQ